MKHQHTIILCCIAFVILGALPLKAQFQKLDSLSGYQLKVYYSNGQEERAREIAKLSHDAILYTEKIVRFRPAVNLLVLSSADWNTYTKFPVYGMPHYTNDKTLVVAAEDNDFWKSFIPPMDQIPSSLAEQVKKVYSQDGTLTMQPFFDLLALHELGHAFHQQASLNMQRKWMGELFCNILLHTYIAENEPARLPALTVFPNMVVAAGTNGYAFTTLEQFESNYYELGTQHPKNYGWYQSRLHAGAGHIYNAGGKEVFSKLWLALQVQDKKDDNKLSEQMANEVHPSISEMMAKW